MILRRQIRGWLSVALLCAFTCPVLCAQGRGPAGPMGLLNSEYTERIYQKRRADYPLLFGIWREAVRRQDLDFQVLRDADVEHGDLLKYSALILPGAVALSDAEWQAIERFVQAGGGLLLGGASGTLAPDGAWRGWDRVRHLADLADVRALRKKDFKSLYVTLMGGSPMTLGLPAGLRIENEFHNENYAGVSSTQDAYWAESAKPLLVSDRNTYYTAVKTARFGKGRVVWLGFNLESMSEAPENQQALLTLLGNAMRWAKQEPVAHVALWPQGRQAAVSLTFDCENDFGNLANLLNRHDASKFRFTFFMLSSMAESFPDLVRRSTTLGEVAIHGDDHSIFRAQSYATQAQRLVRAQEKLQWLSGLPVVSFRPPLQRFDANTLTAMRKTGIKNFFSDYTLSSTPFFQAVERSGAVAARSGDGGDNTLVTFPRPSYDDYDLFVRYQLSNDQAIDYITEDFNRVEKEHGHYILNMHTTSPWGGLTRHKIRVLSTLMHRLGTRDDLWFPTIGEVGQWWLTRSRIDLKLIRDWDESLRLEITNRNDRPVHDLAVEVYLPDAYRELKLDPTTDAEVGSRRLDKSENKLTVTAPTLAPRSMSHLLLAPGKQGE